MKATCPTSGKVRYRDRIAARLAVASAPAHRRKPGAKDECRVYRCPSCGGFHTTSKRRWLP